MLIIKLLQLHKQIAVQIQDKFKTGRSNIVVNGRLNLIFFKTAFACNFDKDDCGFKQDKDDIFDWTRKSGSTPSGNTGPAGDHTTGKGLSFDDNRS